MRILYSTTILPLLFSLILAESPALQADTIKCWTNHEGFRECGNIIPPEFSQNESFILNDRGMVQKRVDRAKSRSEVAKAREKDRLERLEQLKREKERRTREEYDRVLLSTFLYDDEIIVARDRKLSLLKGNIELTKIGIKKLQQRLEDERHYAANLERQGRVVPDETIQQMDSINEQIDSKLLEIEEKELEKEKIFERYQADLVRFRQLKASGR